jgi:hypothetical protein
MTADGLADGLAEADEWGGLGLGGSLGSHSRLVYVQLDMLPKELDYIMEFGNGMGGGQRVRNGAGILTGYAKVRNSSGSWVGADRVYSEGVMIMAWIGRPWVSAARCWCSHSNVRLARRACGGKSVELCMCEGVN